MEKMAGPIMPPNSPSANSLSSRAKTLLRYFRDNNIAQMDWVLPATLEQLFPDSEDCELAQAELSEMGLIDLNSRPPAHIPVRSRVVAAALTLEGERYIAKNDIS
jgi:hypothetical protein